MQNQNLSVIDALNQRFSTRAYLDKPVAREVIVNILDHARHSPSGANLQPWQVAVVTGASKKKLSENILHAYDNSEKQRPDHPYYPQDWFEPYKTRRFETGMALYNALNIKREDKLRRQQQWKANYDFFGAPVGIIFLVDKRLGQGCWVDMGMFIQSVMLAAQSYNLATCPQASLGDYPDIVRTQLGLSDNMLVMCGMALGYADTSHPVNNYRTEREPVDNFTQWFD